MNDVNDDDYDDLDGILGRPIDNELENAILKTGIALEIPNIDVANAIVNEIIHPIQNNAVIACKYQDVGTDWGFFFALVSVKRILYCSILI